MARSIIALLILLPTESGQEGPGRAAQGIRDAMRGGSTSRIARRQQGRPLPPPDLRDVHYGPHKLQTFDLWKAKSAAPTPLVLFIHGGGFRAGDKALLSGTLLTDCLRSGFSVAAINYRLIPEVCFPAPMEDCARAVQVLRHRARELNLDPTRIASTGGSAGGGISLWLAFHPDLADPASADPITRESTRLTCVAVQGAQSSYDPRFAEQIGLKGLARHRSFVPFYGLKPDELETPRAYQLFEAASPITYATPDDPPVLLDYNQPNSPVDERTPQGIVVHHPKFGLALKERLDKLGVECIVQYPGDGHGRRITSGEFIRRHFGRPTTTTKPK